MKSTWTTVGLIVAIILCAAFVPWTDLGRESKSTVKEALKTRFAEYAALRMQDDWNALYDMTLPRHREQVDRTKFLSFYGRGVLIPRKIELIDVAYTERLNIGATKFFSRVEMVLDKLPPAHRKGLQVNSPDDLIKEGEQELGWMRVGGQWYFEMAPEVVSGQSGGRAISAFGEKPGSKPK